MVRVKDVEGETLSIESVPIVREFLEVFPNDHPGFPSEWEINIGIELLSYTNPILIRPYKMAPDELNELKLQCNDLLDKGFIQPSISP